MKRHDSLHPSYRPAVVQALESRVLMSGTPLAYSSTVPGGATPPGQYVQYQSAKPQAPPPPLSQRYADVPPTSVY